MLKTLYAFFLSSITPVIVFADGGMFWSFSGGSDTATEAALKTWDIHIDDIPVIIRGAIDFFMWIAGTIAVIFIIIGAYQILLGSLEQDKTKGKTTVVLALTWFAIASLSWFIVKFILDNFR